MLPKNKIPYLPPELDVYYYVVERGFAETPISATPKHETFSEINNNESGKTTIGGENYTGTWGGTEWMD